jgi:uncharacterized alpha-E superfamily protein
MNGKPTEPQLTNLQINAPPRPVLSRDADGMYWMTRYVERAEHVARLLLIHSNILIDVGDLDEKIEEQLWNSILDITFVKGPVEGSGSLGSRIMRHMTFAPGNSNSIFNCITRARENARGLREAISAEMWEHLNTLYWSMCADDVLARYEESPDAFFRMVMNGSMLFQGLTHHTLAHDEPWHFAQLGKYLERIIVTCRIVETKFEILRTASTVLDPPLRNLHWMGVLRACCSIEEYRRVHLGDMDPLKIAAFLILDRNFPRTIRYGVNEARMAIEKIRIATNPQRVIDAERILARLDNQLEYAEMSEILIKGVPQYVHEIQQAVNDASMNVLKTYFPR